MAASFSTVKAVSTLIANGVARRGYAAASQAPNVMLKKGSKDLTKTSWGPDPVTGYYRPENRVDETDSAELRKILVNEKATTN